MSDVRFELSPSSSTDKEEPLLQSDACRQTPHLVSQLANEADVRSNKLQWDKLTMDEVLYFLLDDRRFSVFMWAQFCCLTVADYHAVLAWHRISDFEVLFFNNTSQSYAGVTEVLVVLLVDNVWSFIKCSFLSTSTLIATQTGWVTTAPRRGF